MEKKGLKISMQIKTRWISILKLVKHMLAQYSILLYKMHLDSSFVKAAQTNLEFLIDFQMLHRLAAYVGVVE